MDYARAFIQSNGEAGVALAVLLMRRSFQNKLVSIMNAVYNRLQLLVRLDLFFQA
jgi:hypothetical protein